MGNCIGSSYCNRSRLSRQQQHNQRGSTAAVAAAATATTVAITQQNQTGADVSNRIFLSTSSTNLNTIAVWSHI